MAFQRLMDDALAGETAGLSKKSNKVRKGSPSVTERPNPVSRTTFREGTVRAEIKKAFEDVDPNVEGMKPFSTLKQKTHKYLWVLEFGRRKAIDAMTNGEIAYVLSDMLYEPATDVLVANLRFKVQNGYVQPRRVGEYKAWKIMQNGINQVADSITHETLPKT